LIKSIYLTVIGEILKFNVNKTKQGLLRKRKTTEQGN